jgi:hypothetical protein
MDVWIATIQSHILGCLEDNEPTYVTIIGLYHNNLI